jgi:hypothetical protein
MNLIAEIMLRLDKIVQTEKERKLTPSENLQKKLYAACMDNRNRRLGVCLRIPELISNGLNNATFTTMGEFELARYYQTHGYLSGNVSLTGLPLAEPDVIFTNPKTQEYCVQSLYRDLLIPQPRPHHDYPQNDLWELLKFRLEADTFFCTVHFPAYFTPSDISYRMGKLLTGNPGVHKSVNPAYGSFMTIFNTFVEIIENFPNLSLTAAGAEILSTHFFNLSMNTITAEIIKRNLVNTSRVHLFLATEPVRLGWADTLDGIPIMEKLWSVARTSLCEIRYLMDVLKIITRAKYATLMFENEASFDLIPENHLRTLDFLIHNTGNITAAINSFSTCPYEIPVFNEELERTFLGDQMIIADEPISMNLASYRDASRSQLTIAKRNLTPDGKIENYFSYKLNDLAPRLSLTDAAKTAINKAGNLRFMLTCKQALLLLDDDSRYTINLGMIQRPKIREILAFRQYKFINTILNKNFEEDISRLFLQNQTALPANAYEFLLLSGNIDPIMYLNFYDSCTRLSPLSPYFEPTTEFDYIVDFGYDIVSIHSNIMAQCTLRNAAALLYSFNVTFAITYFGRHSLFEICKQFALDSGRSRFHDFLAGYMSEDMHELEDQFEDRIGPPPLLPFIALTFSMALFFFLYTLRCFRKRSNTIASAQPLSREPVRHERLPTVRDDRTIPFTVINAPQNPQRFFTPRVVIATATTNEKRPLIAGTLPDEKRHVVRPMDKRMALLDEARRAMRK